MLDRRLYILLVAFYLVVGASGHPPPCPLASLTPISVRNPPTFSPIEVIRLLRKAKSLGYPFRPSFFFKSDSPIKEVAQEMFERHFNGIEFEKALIQHFEQWRHAFAFANCEWTPYTVIVAIKAIHGESETSAPKRPLNKGLNLEIYGPVLEQTFFSGKTFGRFELHDQAIKYFGTWDNALVAAELGSRSSKKNVKWSKELFIEILAQMDAAGFRVNSELFKSDPSGRIREFIFREFGLRVEATAFRGSLLRYFDDWREPLLAAGVTEVSEPRQDWSQFKNKQLLAVLKKMEREGEEVNAGAFYRPKVGKKRLIIKEILGIDVHPGKFWNALKYRFFTWDEALIGANLDPFEIRKVLWKRGRLTLLPLADQITGSATGRPGEKSFLVGRAPKETTEGAQENELFDTIKELGKTVSEPDRDLLLQIVDVIVGSNAYLTPSEISAVISVAEADVARLLGILATRVKPFSM